MGCRRPAWRRLSGLCLAGFTGLAVADIDSSAYDASGSLRSERERQQIERQFAAERAAESARLAAAEAAARLAAAAAAAREAARPPDERLTEQRCTKCHAHAHYSVQRHTRIGWTLVVARMVYLNDALIAEDEQSMIIDYLARAYPADAEAVVHEIALPGALLLAVPALVVWRARRKRTPRERRPQDGDP